MKNRFFVPEWSILFFLLTMAVVLFSWIGSIYGLGSVQSLLSAEGVRWVLSHVVENYVETPALGITLILLMGLGIVARSGLWEVMRRLFRKDRKLSRKERRALTLASLALLLYGGIVAVMMLLPWNFLQSVTGSWWHSPFSRGFIYILSLGMGWMGLVYGYASNAFRGISDVVGGMGSLIARRSSYFVSLFFVVQFFSSLQFTHLAEWMGLVGLIFEVPFQIFCYLPLIWMSPTK